jgi:hypothetical protein
MQLEKSVLHTSKGQEIASANLVIIIEKMTYSDLNSIGLNCVMAFALTGLPPTQGHYTVSLQNSCHPCWWARGRLAVIAAHK